MKILKTINSGPMCHIKNCGCYDGTAAQNCATHSSDTESYFKCCPICTEEMRQQLEMKSWQEFVDEGSALLIVDPTGPEILDAVVMALQHIKGQVITPGTLSYQTEKILPWHEAPVTPEMVKHDLEASGMRWK